MSDYIISRRLSSGCLYAYCKRHFWLWDDSTGWKESPLMTQKFERYRAAMPRLTPEDFMMDTTKFEPLDDWELDMTRVAMLKRAKPGQTAQADPVEEDTPDAETPPSPAPQDKAVTTVPAADIAEPFGNAPAAPGFDFSPLGELSAQAAEADQQFDLHYGTAQDEYLISCIYLARIHALTAKAGRYGGGTWTKWYESKGLSHGSVTKMVQNGEAFNSSTVDELKQLPELTRKDLNLIARSGCADQLVQAAGNDQRVQQLLDQLKAEKSRADTAEAHLEAAHADINGLTERAQKAESERDKARADQLSTAKDCNRLGLKVSQEKDRADKAEAREKEAWKMQSKAETRAQEAEKQLEGSRQVAEAAKLRGDKLKAENDALKSQPITAVVDKEEVRRQAEEMAAGMTANLRAQLDKTAADTQQDARDAYDSILMAGRSMHNSWQTVRQLFRKLPERQREAAANQLVQTLAAIQGEVSRCL